MIPEHYARDVVERCEHLIESLLPVVMDDADKRFGGPLSSIAANTSMRPVEVKLPLARMAGGPL